jgi:hypothetical protein
VDIESLFALKAAGAITAKMKDEFLCEVEHYCKTQIHLFNLVSNNIFIDFN